MINTTQIQQLGNVASSLQGQTLQPSRKSVDQQPVAVNGASQDNPPIADLFQDIVSVTSTTDRSESQTSQQSSKADIKVQMAENLRRIVEDVQKRATSVQFKIDTENNEVIVTVVDRDGNVIRQIPPDEILRLQSQLKEMKGVLFQEVS